MRVLGLDKIEKYKRKHADTRDWFTSWLCEVRDASWQNPQDVKDRYNSASIVNDRKIILNVKGNNHRLEIIVSFKQGTVLVKWIGTHAEYTKRYS